MRNKGGFFERFTTSNEVEKLFFFTYVYTAIRTHDKWCLKRSLKSKCKSYEYDQGHEAIVLGMKNEFDSNSDGAG